MRGSLFLSSVAAWGLLLTACGGVPQEAAPPGGAARPSSGGADRPPNIVVILADDLGWGEIGADGSTRIPTPNIDRLARDGVRFTNAYVASPLCSPSRAGLMTGRYPQRFGHEFNSGPFARDRAEGLGLDLAQTTIADALSRRGYATGLVGKWHLGVNPQFHPMRRGFGEFYGFLFVNSLYADMDQPDVTTVLTIEEKRLGPKRDERHQIYRGTEPVEEKEYLTDAFTREAVSFVTRQADRPFFLMLDYSAPHTPLQATRRYMDRFPKVPAGGPRVYAAMVSALDDGVGAVLEALSRAGLEKKTIVVFLSDNGCAEYTGACSNAPLRGGKLLLTEGGIRVPFLLRWTGKYPAGVTIDEPVSALDLYPTFVSLAGGSSAGEGGAAAPGGSRVPAIDGIDLGPIIAGATHEPVHEALYWRVGVNRAVRKGTWKLMRSGDRLPWLYDLATDPGESRNVAPDHRDIVRDLSALLGAWETTLAPPAWPSAHVDMIDYDGAPIPVYR